MAAAVAALAAVASGAVASVARGDALPAFLQWATTGWGWVVCGAFAGFAAFLTYESQRASRRRPPVRPRSLIYEEIATDSVGSIRRVVIFDRRVAEKYIEGQSQKGGDGDGG